MAERTFFCEEIPPAGGLAVPGPDEHRHIFRVLRFRNGDTISLIDGRGTCAEARIEDESQIRILSVEKRSRPEHGIRLYVSPPRHSGMETVISFCAETAVREIVPVICAFSVAVPGRLPDKWKRRILESCKQSRNPFFPTVKEPMPFDCALGNAVGTQCFYGSPYGGRGGLPPLRKETDISWFVGPEGGFSGSEIAKMDDNGFTPLNLSDSVMRSETAALAGIVWLSNLMRAGR